MLNQAGPLRDIRKGPIVIVPVEATGGLLALWKLTQPPAVGEEDVQPTVIVVIKQGDSAASCREEEVFVFVARNNRFGRQARFYGDVDIGRIVGSGRTGRVAPSPPRCQPRASRNLEHVPQAASAVHGRDYSGRANDEQRPCVSQHFCDLPGSSRKTCSTSLSGHGFNRAVRWTRGKRLQPLRGTARLRG